jgi:hypothetical protein
MEVEAIAANVDQLAGQGVTASIYRGRCYLIESAGYNQRHNRDEQANHNTPKPVKRPSSGML